MKYILLFLAMFLLSGCGEDAPEPIPMNTIDKANELCQSMDGVKSLRVNTDCIRNGKFCSNTLITKVEAVCNRFDAKVSIDIEWEATL